MVSSNLGPDWDQVPGIRPEPELVPDRSFANSSRMRCATVILMPNSDSACNFTSVRHFLSRFRFLVVQIQRKSEIWACWGSGTGWISDFRWNQTTKTRKSDEKSPIDVKFHAESESGIRITVAHRIRELFAKDRSGTSSGSGRIPETWSQSDPKFELTMKFWPYTSKLWSWTLIVVEKTCPWRFLRKCCFPAKHRRNAEWFCRISAKSLESDSINKISTKNYPIYI